MGPAFHRDVRRYGADQGADIVILPERPGELEEGIDEDADEQAELQLEQRPRRGDGKVRLITARKAWLTAARMPTSAATSSMVVEAKNDTLWMRWPMRRASITGRPA
jgi:hypothetical protein